ncbi:GNAT family N-acetyltransferase [Methylophaga frappieri]|uniref:GNAT family N-acetyltransferase n=1 Tax=Methylophaga frappieri (strain ATCC BAA-2434 / DSM 25690 / JAM7) TaxID=754477 RepID=UPI00059BFD6F|nr:GNAT family protein [Methylophaga frappieri]
MEKLKEDHASELYELTECNREYLREWLPWLDSIGSISDTMAFIESTTNGPATFALFYSGKICGVAGFHNINSQHKYGSIGYWIAQNRTGKGIATAAVKELLRIGFEEYSLNKIEIRCAKNNSKSRAIPERLGFKYEASLRQCEWLYSKFVDHAIYSMLASEYRA